MAKLIFSDKLDSFKLKFPGWNAESDDAWRSVAFCEDGYIVTHGKTFRTPLGTNENIYGLGISTVDGILRVTAGGYTTTEDIYVLSGATASTDYITTSHSKGVLTVSHRKPGTTDANRTATTSIGSTSTADTDSEATVAGGFIYDDYGHIVSAASRKLTLDKVRSNVTTTDTIYYLVGQTGGESFNDPKTDYVYRNQNVFIKDGTIYTKELMIGQNGNYSSITDLISASQALYFRGTVDDTLEADDTTNKKFKTLPITNVHVGDLYVVGSGGYTLGSGTNAEVFEAGDMIIATATTPIWSGVQRNLVSALTEANLTKGNDSGNTLYVRKDAAGNLYVTQTDTDTWRAIKIDDTEVIGSTSNAALVFSAGSGITLDGTTTANTISIVNSSPLSNATALTLTFKATSAGEAQDIFSYNPKDTAGKSIQFVGGSNVELAYLNGVFTINSSYVNTLYNMYFGVVNSVSSAETDNATTYLHLNSTGDDSSKVQITGAGSVFVTAKDNKLTIAGVNTWRTVKAWNLSGLGSTNDQVDTVLSGTPPTTGTDDLVFSSTFAYNDTDKEIDLVWAEVTTASDGSVSVSYHV